MKAKIQFGYFLTVFVLLNILAILVIFIFLIKTASIQLANIGQPSDFYSFPALASQVASQISVGSKAYIVYDRNARSVLVGKNERLRFAPASTVKIMTATVALENYDLDQVLTAQNTATIEGSKMGLVDGERITVRNLIYGMMLPSGNDAARTLAQNFPGGQSAFVAVMNQKAKSLSMNNTRFFDPDGYDDNNYTTAYDLARLSAYAMENSTFATIVSTRNVEVTDISGEIKHDLRNLNELLGINYINGIKTGFTDEAGGVLVTSVEHDGRRDIIVVLNSSDRFADTKNVVEATMDRIKMLFY